MPEELSFVTSNLMDSEWDDYFDSLSDEALEQDDEFLHKFLYKVGC